MQILLELKPILGERMLQGKTETWWGFKYAQRLVSLIDNLARLTGVLGSAANIAPAVCHNPRLRGTAERFLSTPRSMRRVPGPS
jgi:hypothetical protein